MSLPIPPTLDPYFSHEGQTAKKVADDLAQLRTAETMIRVAGLAAMLMGAFTFVLFGVPVSGMLRQSDGILLTDGWMWNRWVARMVPVFTISLAASLLGCGLARFRP